MLITLEMCACCSSCCFIPPVALEGWVGTPSTRGGRCSSEETSHVPNMWLVRAGPLPPIPPPPTPEGHLWVCSFWAAKVTESYAHLSSSGRPKGREPEHSRPCWLSSLMSLCDTSGSGQKWSCHSGL